MDPLDPTMTQIRGRCRSGPTFDMRCSWDGDQPRARFACDPVFAGLVGSGLGHSERPMPTTLAAGRMPKSVIEYGMLLVVGVGTAARVPHAFNAGAESKSFLSTIFYIVVIWTIASWVVACAYAVGRRFHGR